jgi:hypothetical protein
MEYDPKENRGNCLLSALGQKQTSRDVRRMSALPPIADICSALADVRFVPIADVKRRNYILFSSSAKRVAKSDDALCAIHFRAW